MFVIVMRPEFLTTSLDMLITINIMIGGIHNKIKLNVPVQTVAIR